MKSIWFQGIAALALAWGASPCFAADVANPGFEVGSLSGWNVTTDRPGSAVLVAEARSGSHALRLASPQAHKTIVSQTIGGLASGQYLLTAMVRNSGGDATAYLFAKDCGGTAKMTSIPVSAGWLKVVVRGVRVAAGKCTIGLSAAAGPKQVFVLDDVAFARDDGPTYDFLLGGDVARLSWIESLGAKFFEGGRQRDAMDILADNGFNWVRLRPYNDPGNPAFYPSNQMAAGFEDTADTLATARRAAAKNMGVQLTLNYSDWWADGCRQDVPHEWVGKSFDEIEEAVYDYSYDIVRRMKDQGTPPLSVSLGNQMQCGLLLNPGNYGPITNWPQLARLLNAGAKAVKDASPESKVMLHLDSPASAPAFFDAAVRHGVHFDQIGVSWYPYWENHHKRPHVDTLPELLVVLNDLAKTYGRDIVIMEAGVNWTPRGYNGSRGQLQDTGMVDYPMTPAGQRDFMYDLINLCKSVDDGRCLGVQYWDPIAVHQLGFGWKVGGGNSDDNAALFDRDHNVLPALTQAFKYNN